VMQFPHRDTEWRFPLKGISASLCEIYGAYILSLFSPSRIAMRRRTTMFGDCWSLKDGRRQHHMHERRLRR
jgi:hypothetical protein